MSATPPTIQGTESPNQIEFFWERYKTLIWTIVFAIVAAMGINYGIKYYKQTKVDSKWSALSVALGLRDSYAPDETATRNLCLEDSLKSIDMTVLETELSKADEASKPYVLLAIARKAMLDSNWSRAEGALADIEKGFPNHSLNQVSKVPVQTREPVKTDKKPEPGKEPELKPAAEGSVVSLMRQQIAAARTYKAPALLEAPTVPANATKVKFTLSGDYGSFVIALWSDKAPKLCKEFLDLAKKEGGGFWKGIAVDEIMRPTKNNSRATMEMHLGLESTRNEDDKTKWSDKDPSKYQVEYEVNDLSHFPGMVSASPVDGKGDKMCADRFWINATDAASHDGDRVIFGQVVEGLDNVKKVCEAAMTVQEEEQGRGKPTTAIRVESVEVLP